MSACDDWFITGRFISVAHEKIMFICQKMCCEFQEKKVNLQHVV